MMREDTTSFDEVVALSSSSSKSSSSAGGEKHDVFVPGRLCLLGEHSDWVRRRIKRRRRKRFEADFFFLSFDSLFSIGCKMTSRVGRRITNNVFVSFSTRLIIHTKKAGGFRREHPSLLVGACLVVGTSEGTLPRRLRCARTR